MARFTIADPAEVAPATEQIPASRPGIQLPPPGASTDVHVRRRMLYIMRGVTRYRLTHAILPNNTLFPGYGPVERVRRITVMCRPKAECVAVGGGGGGGGSKRSYSYGELS